MRQQGCYDFSAIPRRAGTSTLLSVLREIVCGVGLVLMLPIWFGLDGLLWFMAIADIITFVAFLAVLIHIDKSLKKNNT